MEKSLQSPDQAEIDAAFGTMAGLATPDFKAGEEIASRLQNFGIDPQKVDFLINSHLHLDHCGGNASIPNARLVIQKREWEAGAVPELIAENHLIPRQYDLGHDRLEIDGEHDLFGDGSVLLLPTYGHTPGHQSMRVRLPDGDVMLTADACYIREALDGMVLPDPTVVRQADEMRKNFERLREYERNGTMLILGHDPQQWKLLNSGPIEEITSAKVMQSRQLAKPNRQEVKAHPLA
ncbi:hypothetical protein GCM10023208_07000 [Erythrobacter westpacificensis]|uniref:Metallo-beta-lactamase domain-containing protein n=1 Tax=Erythrobacter westpacificensis TaxID=1055231 RepID=A0ABP9K110_9SPHN